MDVAPWKVLTVITVLLIVVGLVASLGDLGPVQLVIGGIMIVLLAGALYVGWRIGREWGDRRRSAD